MTLWKIFIWPKLLNTLVLGNPLPSDNPVGICGPIGPTEQLPLVARLVNELRLDLSAAHFWGMDEWLGEDGKGSSNFTSSFL